MNPDVARAKIREMVKGSKKTIEAEAVTAIVDRTGFSVRGLESEVEKILLYVGSRPDVTATDVMAVLSTSREAGVFAVERDAEKETWLQEVAARAVAEDASIPEAAGSGSAHVYEDTLQRGIPPATSLILTAEIVDQRRSLFKRISELGLVIDCGVRTRKAGETSSPGTCLCSPPSP